MQSRLLTTNLLILSAVIILFCSQGCKNQNVAPDTATPVTIAAISPTSGAAGATVTITGTKFDPTAANNAVMFNGVAATVISATETSLKVMVPAGAGSGKVTVTNNAGIATGPIFMGTPPPPPTISSVAPLNADVNSLVFITGTNFSTTPANNTVNFNGVQATVKTATATLLSVLAPAGGTTGTITVTTAGGTVTGPVFTYKKFTVYVLGSTASGFCYWKNGVRTDLPADANGLNAIVNSIAVSGKDIYVGGSASGQLPAYWKNAAPAVLLPANGQTGYVESIYVSGATVYTSGGIYNSFSSSYILVNWQNGVLNYLLNSQGTQGVAGLVGGMVVNGGNVYICGNISTNSGNNRNAAYWVNGTPTVLSNVTSASANSIFISGANLYLAGAVSGIDQYWTNGIPTLLNPNPTNRGVAPGRNLYVSAGNAYVLAQSNGSAKYWRNGKMLSLTTTEFNGSIATCINGIGDNLYIGGCSDGVNQIWGYWVNGQFNTIPNATNVFDILVM
jgi:hypothetical protein